MDIPNQGFHNLLAIGNNLPMRGCPHCPCVDYKWNLKFRFQSQGAFPCLCDSSSAHDVLKIWKIWNAESLSPHSFEAEVESSIGLTTSNFNLTSQFGKKTTFGIEESAQFDSHIINSFLFLTSNKICSQKFEVYY